MHIHISLVGQQILPIYYAIKKHAPDKIFLIASEQSKVVAKRLKKSVEPSIPAKVEIVDAFALKQIEELCKGIIEKHPDAEYSFNLTGGTKLMAIATYKVALSIGANIEYITTENNIVSLDSYEQAPLDTALDNEEIISLSGHQVQNKVVGDLNSIASSVECSLLIKNFIESEPKVHDRLRRSIQEKYRGNKDLLPSEFTFGEYLFQQYAQGGFNISTVSGEMVLDLPIYDAFDLYFNARWWEILVLEKILRWSEPEDREVWSSVETTLEASTDENVKNEVDVLVNLGTTLLFVECKSGKVSQEDIYKIAAVRNTYGGDMSKSVLVSYNPIDINIQNKCRDNNIEIFAPRYFNERVSHLDHLVNRLGRIESKIRS